MRPDAHDMIGGGFRLATSLPPEPSLGQEVFFLADAANEIVWHLIYLPVPGGSYPWKFLGGAAMYSYIAGPISTTNSTYNNAGGPTVQVPLSGDYIGVHGARGTSSDGNVGRQHLQNASIAQLANDGAEIIWTGAGNLTHSSVARLLAMTAGHTIRVVHAKDTAAAPTITCSQIFLAVTPIRVKP
jgi:hypothetical protein